MRFQFKTGRLISVLLIVIMILTMVPGTAFAADDTTAPEWVSGFPAASNVSDKEFYLKVKSSEAGKVYFVRLADGASAPSAAQVKAGTDAEGVARSYPQAWSLSVDANIDNTIRISGLMPDTAYDVYTVLEDSSLNLQSDPILVEAATTVPDADKSGITDQVMDSNGSKRTQLTIVVKNAAEICSLGYLASDFGVTVDGTPMTFADAQFSGFYSLDSAATGYYEVVFTGDADNTEYTFTDLAVGGVVIESGPTVVTTPPEAASAPTITDAVMEAENKYITITFSEGVYGNSDGTGAINKDDFDLTFAQNGGVVSGASINWVNTTSHLPMAGGETACIVLLHLVDGPATGAETITIHPKANSIYNSAGVAMTATETTGAKNLNVLPAQSFAADYPKLGAVQGYGSHTVQVLAKVVQDGVLNYVVLPDDATSPTAQQIKTHANIDGQAPISYAGQLIGAGFEVPITLSTNLNHDTAYDIYMVAEAGNNNFSEVKKLDVSTPTETAPSAGAAAWHYRSPDPANNLIENIELINGTYMAVGYNGTLISSSDGEVWQRIDVGTESDRLNSIAYGNSKYVIVGNADSNNYVARIFTSDNGVDWHETAAIPHHGLYDVAYGNGQFIAVGEAGKIAVSTDGETWHVIPTEPLTPNAMDYNLLAVTYANGKYVAAGTRIHTGITQRGAVLTSDDGVSWTVSQTDASSTVWDVTYGNGIYAAVGGRSDTAGSFFISTSSDGETWTQRDVPGAPSYARFYSVKYDGSRFVAAGTTTGSDASANKACVVTSDNGTTWTYQGDQSKPYFRTVAGSAADSLYLALGGCGNIYTSDNLGASWTYRTGGTTKALRDVAWNGSMYVAVGYEGEIQTSSDGETWTIRTSGTSYHLNTVEFLNGQFITVGQNGTILTSANGTVWTVQTSGTNVDLQDIAFGGGKYVTGGINGGVLVSSDGANWSASPGLTSLKTVEYGNHVFLALMQYGQVYRSIDGSDWEQLASLPDTGTQYPTRMIYADGKFAAVCGYGKIFLSSDNGASWNFVQSDLDQDYIRDITYADGKFAAVADNGKIIASADGGNTWFMQPSGLAPNPYFSLEQDAQLYAITAGSDSFVSVGGNGLVLESEGFNISTDPDAHAVAMAKSRLYSGHITGSGSNNSLGQIVAWMNLMTSWNYDTSFSWVSSKPEYISSSGTVTRPAFADGDQVVHLTATISKGSASVTKKFMAVVIAQDNADHALVQAAVNALTFDVIKLANTAENNIVSNLNLTTAGINATAISWASSQPAYITVDGVVTRPAEGAADQSVTLTATITKGTVSETRNFYLTVKALVNQDAQDVAAAIAALDFNTIKGSNNEAESITSNLNLATSGINGTTISWTSSKPAYITVDGVVTRPAYGAADVDVTLIATITKGAASQTKQFTVRVKAAPKPVTPGPGSPSTPAPQPVASVIDSEGKISNVTARLDSSTGTVEVVANAALLAAAFNNSEPDVTGLVTVEIRIPAISGAESYDSILPASFLNSGDSLRAIELNTALASVTLTGNMLDAGNMSGIRTVTLSIAAGDKNKLDEAVRQQIGNRPVIALALRLDGQQTSWNNENAPVKVTIPYSPTAEELRDPEHIVIWYLDGTGNAVSVPSGRFDPATGTVTFSTTHFSDYAIAYVHKTFADLDDAAWAKKAIEVMASKGIINGTGKDFFSPKASITRADYMVMLIKSLGLTADFKNNFTDVKTGTYYYEALGIAKELGITTGSGDNQFRPKEKISRQDMMVLTARALDKAKKLKTEGNLAALDQFSDRDHIAGYAEESLAALIQKKLVTGSGNKLNPGSDTTRAEAAVFLYRIYNQ